MIRKTLLAMLVLAALPNAAPAQQQQSIVIDATGLETPDGAIRFRAALNAALVELCGDYATAGHDQWDSVRECRAGAIRIVNRQLATRRDLKNVRLAAR